SKTTLGRRPTTPTTSGPSQAAATSLRSSPGGAGEPIRSARSRRKRFWSGRRARRATTDARSALCTSLAARRRPMASLDHDEDRALLDGVALGDADLRDPPGARRLDGDLHLHRLDDEDHLL